MENSALNPNVMALQDTVINCRAAVPKLVVERTNEDMIKLLRRLTKDSPSVKLPIQEFPPVESLHIPDELKQEMNPEMIPALTAKLETLKKLKEFS